MSFLYSAEKGELFSFETLQSISLEGVASDIVRLYLDGKDPDDIAQDLARIYEVSVEEAFGDTVQFLEQLKSRARVRDLRAAVVADHLDRQPHLKTPIVHIIQNCNSPCRTCDCWKTKDETRLSFEQLVPVFDLIKRMGAASVMISGGEPLLHPEICEILGYLKAIGLPIELNTNGIALDRCAHLAGLGIEQLVISLDGYDRASYRLLRGANAFDKVLANAKEFLSLSPSTKLGFRTTLTKHNLFHLDKVAEVCKLAGGEYLGFSPADVSSESFSREGITSDRVSRLTDLMLPTLEDIECFRQWIQDGHEYVDKLSQLHEIGLLGWAPSEILRCLQFYESIRSNSVRAFDKDPCKFPDVSFIVDYDGSLKSCFYSDTFGHIDDLEKVTWSLKERLKRIKERNRCATCRGKVFCDSAKVLS